MIRSACAFGAVKSTASFRHRSPPYFAEIGADFFSKIQFEIKKP
jgi:hypothetical protein